MKKRMLAGKNAVVKGVDNAIGGIIFCYHGHTSKTQYTISRFAI